MKQPRGLRNNNPLNIIKNKNIDWKGQLCNSTDPTFVQFDTMAHGLRATLMLLRTYYNKHACTTLRMIISRWAPETENQVSAYINTVCKLTGWNADSHLPPMKKETKVVWFGIVLAMASVECGLNNEGRQSLRPDLEKAWDMLYNPFIISC